MMELPYKGNLKAVSLPRILVYLNRNRKTGTLIVKSPAFIKKIFLSKGDAIFASSSYEDDRLGEMLIKAGKITMEQYEKSVELLKQAGKRQGAILVELGYLTPKDLFWGVKYQVREIIYSLFQLENGEYEFIEDELPTREVITLKMSMGNLIYEGVKRIDNLTRIKNELPEGNTVLKLSSDPVALFQDIELTSQDKKMLSLVDGTKTMKELIDSSWIGSFEAMKILYVLWSIGILEQKEKLPEKPEVESLEQEPAIQEILQPFSEDEDVFKKRVDELFLNLESLNEYQLLEIDENADEDILRKNYYRLSKEFHPDRYFSSADPTIKDKLTAIFDAITQAFNTLEKSLQEKEQGIIPESDKHEESVSLKQGAEEQFKRGVEEFKRGDYWAAVDFLRGATKLEPTNPKYWSHLSLFLTKLPNSVKDASDALSQAIKLEPDNAEHYANLGMIYIKAGMKKRAYTQFEKALQLDPHNQRARKWIEKAK